MIGRKRDALGTWLLQRLEGMGAAEVPESDLLVAYVEGHLSDEESAGVEALLARSDAGRAKLESAMAVGAIEATPVAATRPSRWVTGLVAAAALVVVGVGLVAFGFIDLPTNREATATLLQRAFDSARATDAEALQAYEPLTAAELESAGPSAASSQLHLWEPAFVMQGAGSKLFRWSAVPGAKGYRLSVQDAAGKDLYEIDTDDASHEITPDALRLFPGQAYRWAVVATTDQGPVRGECAFRLAEAAVTRRLRRGLAALREAAGPRLSRLAEAHLAVRYEMWAHARLLAQAYTRMSPGDKAGARLLERIHRQLGIGPK